MGLMKSAKYAVFKVRDNMLVVSSKSVEFEILSARLTILGHLKFLIDNPQKQNFKIRSVTVSLRKSAILWTF